MMPCLYVTKIKSNNDDFILQGSTKVAALCNINFVAKFKIHYCKRQFQNRLNVKNNKNNSNQLVRIKKK